MCNHIIGFLTALNLSMVLSISSFNKYFFITFNSSCCVFESIFNLNFLYIYPIAIKNNILTSKLNKIIYTFYILKFYY